MTTLLLLSDTFAPLSDEIIVYIFNLIANNTAAVGPFGTFFESILTLCQFRLISKRFKSILTKKVICTLLNRDIWELRNIIRAEKAQLGLISESYCNNFYCVYSKDIAHLSPVLRENPKYMNENQMKLYPKLCVIACCIRKYGTYQIFLKFHHKKIQNQRTPRLIKTNSNNYDGLLHLTHLPPPPSQPITRTLQCDVKNCSAKKRLFCIQGLKDHKKVKHSNLM